MQQPFPEFSERAVVFPSSLVIRMKLLHYGLSLLFLSAACTRSNPAAVPSPDISQPLPAATFPTTRSWTLTPNEEFNSYSSRAVTTLELQETGNTVQDSFVVTLDFTVRIQRDEDLSRVTGTLDRLHREPEVLPSPTELPVVMPFSFVGRVSSGGFTLDSAGGRATATVPDCENAGLNQMSIIQRNLALAPLTLATGTTWTDSSTVATCSGTIPVELTSIRTYTIAGEARGPGDISIAVDRSERIRAAGEGAQGQHRIGLQATGLGSARLFLDPASGLLKLAEGETRTTITVHSSGRHQRFLQTVRERTTRTQQ